MIQTYRTLRVAPSGGGVLGVVIDAPPICGPGWASRPDRVPHQRHQNPFDDPTSYAEYLMPEGPPAQPLRRRHRPGQEPDHSPPRRPQPRPAHVARQRRARYRVDGAPVHVPAQNAFLPTDLRTDTDPTAYGRAIHEQIIFLATGIGGLFTDQADIGVQAPPDVARYAPVTG